MVQAQVSLLKGLISSPQGEVVKFTAPPTVTGMSA